MAGSNEMSNLMVSQITSSPACPETHPINRRRPRQLLKSQSRAFFADIGYRREESLALALLCALAMTSGHYDESHTYTRTALELIGDLNDLIPHNWHRMMETWAWLYAGRVDVFYGSCRSIVIASQTLTMRVHC